MSQTVIKACVAVALAAMVVGCRPQAKTLAVSKDDPAELAAVKALEVARVDYEFRLGVLRERAKYSGDAQKETWAKREIENLHGCQTVKCLGLEVQPPSAESLTDVGTPLLAELVVAARQEFLRAAVDLQTLYEARKDQVNAASIKEMLGKFNPIHTYRYYLSAEIPPATLRASQVVLAADAAFDKAMAIYKESTSLLKTVDPAERTSKQLLALSAFGDIIAKHPNSNKIGRCAYYIGEIYRDNGEYVRASVWYDRAWQWDSKLPEAPRYRAATMYDYKTNESERALKYYRLSVKYEQSNPQFVAYAEQRIKEMTARR